MLRQEEPVDKIVHLKDDDYESHARSTENEDDVDDFNEGERLLDFKNGSNIRFQHHDVMVFQSPKNMRH